MVKKRNLILSRFYRHKDAVWNLEDQYIAITDVLLYLLFDIKILS